MKDMLKKRILFVGPYPPPFAGPEMSMKTLLESPLKDRFDITLLNTNFRRSNDQRGKIGIAMVSAFFNFIMQLTCFLVRKRPKVVYYFVTATMLGWLGRDVWCIWLSRLFGAKIVIHMRAGHFRRNYDNANTLQKKIVKYACSFVSLGFVQAYNLRNQFCGLISEEKIVYIYNSIDTEQYHNNAPLTYDPNLILFLGHLSYAKGYCDLLKTFKEIIDVYPDTRFCFAGTKIEHETNILFNQITGEKIKFEKPDECFQRYVMGNYERNYIYLGFVNESTKLALLRECNFLVLPSYSEGFSMAVLEALSMGKPVVCTPVGALGDIVKHRVNGMLAVPGDIRKLTDNILTLMKDKELRNSLALNNITYVRQNFSIHNISKIIGDYFDMIIDKKIY